MTKKVSKHTAHKCTLLGKSAACWP